MAWVDQTYMNYFIGATQTTNLFAGSTPGTYDSSVFAQFEAGARSTVVSVLQYAGYPSPGSTLTAGSDATAMLQKLVAAVMVRDAYSIRRGVNQATREGINETLGLLDAIYNKKLPISGMEPSSANGYGGVQFSPTSEYSTNARPRVFNLRGSGF